MSVVFNQAKPAELVEKHAEQFAGLLTQKLSRNAETTKSQLRRFYQEYLSLWQKIKTGGPNAYQKNEVAIKLLIAKAEYSTGRQNVKVPREFVDWFKNNLKAIKDANDVETFGVYFEAVIGYFYAKKQQDTERRFRR